MSAHEIAGGAARYDRLPDNDIDADSEPSEHPASGTDADTDASHSGTPPALRSIVRRRRHEPRPSPVKAMSLVGLKNLFFKQTVTAVPKRTQPSREYGIKQTSTNESDSPDVESQSTDSKNEKAKKKKGFRVDARVISDATIGLSDGLTVPFALTAGLSALGNTKVVIFGGFAELIAGAISMGLGGYLGAKSEASSYRAQRGEAEKLVATNPQTVLQDITEVFGPYNVPKQTLNDLVTHLSSRPNLVDFVMKFHHCEEEPASSRALTSAITIAVAYFLGGLLPLIPYFCIGDEQVYLGLYISIGVMVVALFGFGYVKEGAVIGFGGGRNIRMCCFSGVQMVVVGSIAAGAAMGLVRLFNRGEHAAGVSCLDKE